MADIDKIPHPICPDDLAPPPAKYVDERRAVRRGDFGRRRKTVRW